jgi:hypothetical protein
MLSELRPNIQSTLSLPLLLVLDDDEMDDEDLECGATVSTIEHGLGNKFTRGDAVVSVWMLGGLLALACQGSAAGNILV